MSEMVRRTTTDGWVFVVGDGLPNREMPFYARVEAPDGEVQVKAFASDNDARRAVAEAMAAKGGGRYRLKE